MPQVISNLLQKFLCLQRADICLLNLMSHSITKSVKALVYLTDKVCLKHLACSKKTSYIIVDRIINRNIFRSLVHFYESVQRLRDDSYVWNLLPLDDASC